MSADAAGDTRSSPPAALAPAAEPRYWAFLSYSQADAAEAVRLHRALEAYRIPRRLVGRVTPRGAVPHRLFPIFRDRDDLSGAPDLTEAIRAALGDSRHLVVLCSPHSAVSRYVDLEIRAFQGMGRGDRVFAIVLNGEPGASNRPDAGVPECFPRALLERSASERRASASVEPLAPDLRPGKDGWRDGPLKLIAGLVGLPYDELRQREQARQRARRVRLAALCVVAALLLGVLYVGLADHGANLPGAEGIRTFIDRRDASLLRPTPTREQLRAAARALQPPLVARLKEDWAAHGWVRTGGRRSAETKRPPSVWVASQVMTGLLHAWTPGARDIEEFLPLLELPFAPGVARERDGVPYGWGPGGETFTQAEPALWTAAALALALSHEGLLDAEGRERALRHLEYVHRVLDLFHPVARGGWNLFPDQEDPGAHSVYTTALALLALQETRAAGVTWTGKAGSCDDLLRCTARWLVENFDARSDPPGWRPEADVVGPVADGLTLQIYAELLRAEARGLVVLPPALLAGARAHVASLASRSHDFPRATASLGRVFTNHDGKRREERQTIELAWQPWGALAAWRMLEREERLAGETLDRVRARRSLAHLLVDLAPRIREAVASRTTETFVVSELLYAVAEME